MGSSIIKSCLLLSAVVLGFFCIAGAVAYCVIYYQFAVQMGVEDLERRVSELRSKLNQTDFAMTQVEAQILDVNSQVEDQIEMFQTQFSQFLVDVNNNRDSQISQTRSDFMDGLEDNGINDVITEAETHRNTFINNVAVVVSRTLADLNTSLSASLATLTADFAQYETQLKSDWNASIALVDDRIGLSGEHKTYIRYGSSICPSTPGIVTVYAGSASSAAWNVQGTGSNVLCLPSEVEYGSLPENYGRESQLYGAEYESSYLGVQNENMPCAVCSVTNRPEVIMIPAKTVCPTSWTREYYGYLMSENRGNRRTSFICVDRSLERIDGLTGNQIGSDFWIVEAICNGNLPCPPYNNEDEMSCVVCSK